MRPRIGSLELFLHQETGIDQDSVLAYLPDGRRLTNSNIRELNGSQTQSIYVFNKYYLDLPLDDVLRELRVEAPLQPPIEGLGCLHGFIRWFFNMPRQYRGHPAIPTVATRRVVPAHRPHPQGAHHSPSRDAPCPT